MALYDYFMLVLNVALFSLCVLKLVKTIKSKRLKGMHVDAGYESERSAMQTFSRDLQEKARDDPMIHTSQTRVNIVCLTGGPCAGKTSVITKLVSMQRGGDFQVYHIPDVRNLVREGGFVLQLDQLNASQKIRYITSLLKLQMKIENIIFGLSLMTSKKVLILVEKGTLDYKPLLSPELWQGLLNENGWKESSLSNTRYHMVIHLETAARGALGVFNLWNDGMSTAERAMEVDLELKEVWKSHHHFRALRNLKGLFDFEAKTEEAMRSILTFVNPSAFRQHKRKFLVECDHPATWGVKNCYVEIIETIMPKQANDGSIEKVEHICSQNGDHLYIQKISIRTDAQSSQNFTAVRVIQYRHVITPKQYLGKKSAGFKLVLRKRQFSFLFKTNHYTLTKYLGKREWVMRVLTRAKEEAVQIPHFVRVIRDLQCKLYTVGERIDVSSLQDEEVPATKNPEVAKPDTAPSKTGKSQGTQLQTIAEEQETEEKEKQEKEQATEEQAKHPDGQVAEEQAKEQAAEEQAKHPDGQVAEEQAKEQAAEEQAKGQAAEEQAKGQETEEQHPEERAKGQVTEVASS